MEDKYTTITKTIGEGFYSEKRSKFLAFAHHVESQAQIREILSVYRKKNYHARHLSYAKIYFDSRYVCYAYFLGADKADYKMNDDGEPSSTAGKPIYGQIVSNDLTDILIVVIRYYGGVNLGTGGLIVAYRTAAADALSHCVIEEKYIKEKITFTFPYVMMNGVMKVVKTMEPQIISQEFDNTCKITLSIRRSKAEELKNKLNSLSFE